MKKGSFPAMLYRELLICRKSLIARLVLTLTFSMIPILVILSIQYGNMAMLPASIIAGIRSNNDLMLKLFAVICPCMLIMVVSESSLFDAQILWERFRRSTPVTPVRMALAKYALYSILLTLSAGLCLGILALCSALLGTAVTRTDIAVIMVLICLTSILCIGAQVLIMCFRSVDKGMVAMLVCAAAVIFLIPSEWKASFTLEWLLAGVTELLPLTPVIIIGILALGFGLTAFLYGRREK